MEASCYNLGDSVSFKVKSKCIPRKTSLDVYICQVFPESKDSNNTCVLYDHFSSHYKKLEIILKTPYFEVGNIYCIKIQSENNSLSVNAGEILVNRKCCKNGVCTKIALRTT